MERKPTPTELFFSGVDESIMPLFDAIGNDYKQLLHLQIEELAYRKKNILMRLAELRSGKEMVVKSASSQMLPTGGKKTDGKEATRVIKLIQETESVDNRIVEYEKILTQMETELRRSIGSLRRYEESEDDDNG